MKQLNQPRRIFLQKALSTSLSLVGLTAFVTSCQSTTTTETSSPANTEEAKTAEAPASTTAIDDCQDFSDVSEAELSKRKSLGYEDVTPFSDKQCDNCQLYIPVKEGKKCGGCMLFKGPVFANAHCTYWAPQTEA